MGGDERAAEVCAAGSTRHDQEVERGNWGHPVEPYRTWAVHTEKGLKTARKQKVDRECPTSPIRNLPEPGLANGWVKKPTGRVLVKVRVQRRHSKNPVGGSESKV